VTEEEFMKSLQALSQLKIRYSWGKTGNQAINSFQTLSTLGSWWGSGYPYYAHDTNNATGFQINTPANPGLKWETTNQSNIGIDLGLFKQRLTMTIDLYKKTTYDLLLNKAMPAYTGFSTALYNVGSVENKGLEIQLSATPVETRDFRWNTDANISFNRDKVLELSQKDERLSIRMGTGAGYNLSDQLSLKQIREGEPLEQMYGYICLGTWGTHEAAEAREYGRLPGDLKFLDVYRRDHPGEPVRSNLDLNLDGNQIIGNAAPKFYYGWCNTFAYKNFELQFLIQGSYGNDIFYGARIRLERNDIAGTYGTLKNYWTPDNQDTYIPALTPAWTRTQANLGPNKMNPATRNWSIYVEDGSYIRMKYITLWYNLPDKVMKTLPIQHARFYVSGFNLFTITKYSGYDPEVSSYNVGGTGTLGVDLSNYPSAKVFTLGLNLTF
jgi:TonB-linked SusC/RagA family outer membrane protein